MSHFSTFRLDQERLDEALPLVGMACPGIERERWLAYGAALARRGGGVMVATASDGAMHGLALYRPEDDLRHGKVIRVDMMLAFELNPTGPVRRSLLAALDLVGQYHEAQGLLLVIAGPGGRATASSSERSLEGVGFRQEAALFWKPSTQTRGGRCASPSTLSSADRPRP